MFTTALLIAASLFAPTADVAVDLDAKATYLLPGARYDVTITNHGPKPLVSATVVVSLAYPTSTGDPQPCVHDPAANTITCTFGPLPPGGSATMSKTVYYYSVPVQVPAVRIDAVATRTASSPADPNPANDVDTKSCWYDYQPGIPPSPYPPLSC